MLSDSCRCLTLLLQQRALRCGFALVYNTTFAQKCMGSGTFNTLELQSLLAARDFTRKDAPPSRYPSILPLSDTDFVPASPHYRIAWA